jgi:hypothetical protein
MLFRPLGGNVAEEKITRAQNNGRTNRLLRHFVAGVNAYCQTRNRTDTIPVPRDGVGGRRGSSAALWPGISPASPAAPSPEPFSTGI